MMIAILLYNKYKRLTYVIKTNGSESRGQEAACARVFMPTRPLQLAIYNFIIYMHDRSKYLKCCSSATITAIA